MKQLPGTVKFTFFPALLTLGMLILCLMPGVSAALELRPHIPEWHTVFTGHFVHYSFRHFFYDGAVFLVLGTVIARRYGVKSFLILTTGTILTVSLLLPVLAPQFDSYRGISAADTALVALAACGLLRDRNRFWRMAAAATLAGMIFKFSYEILLGTNLFVRSDIFAPVAAAHLIGALCGILFALTRLFTPIRSTSAGARESASPLP